MGNRIINKTMKNKKLRKKLSELYRKYNKTKDIGELYSIMLDIVDCEILLERECNK